MPDADAALRKILMHFVDDPERAIRDGEAAFDLFPRMIALAREAGLPADDIEFMRDTFRLIALARRYYFLPFDPALPPAIEAAILIVVEIVLTLYTMFIRGR